MTDISELLQEAKPLYYKRKAFKKKLQSCCAILLCVGSLSLFHFPSDSNFDIDEELYLTETGGVIEDMGLPTDSYGLLKVI